MRRTLGDAAFSDPRRSRSTATASLLHRGACVAGEGARGRRGGVEAEEKWLRQCV